MRVLIQSDFDKISIWAANHICQRINNFNPTADKPFVIGLPTGSSPLGVYRELIKLYKEGKISFENVVSFNMDEYVGLEEGHKESYKTFMHENFFQHVNFKPENINIPNGNASDLEAECKRYEDKIKSYGKIHLFMGGVGPDGHIAFNEPGSSLQSRTRLKTLTLDTKIANSRFFDNDISKVPSLALTVGVGTVTDSEEVMILINGHNKAQALQQAIEGNVNHMWTVTALQLHKAAIIVADEEAAAELKYGTVKYFKDIEKENLL